MRTKQPSSSKVTVALAADDRFIYGLLVLASALERTAHLPLRLVVGYFPGELSPKNRDLIAEYLTSLRVEHIFIESSPHELFTERRHLTITTFLKFVIADALPEPHLWLDIDIIVRSGWDEIYASMTAAPPNVSLVVARRIESPHTRFVGFNAGVLGWTSSPRKPWMATLANLPEKRFSSEQYLFNTLYQESVLRVGSIYNFLSSWHEQLPLHPHARIIHFSGPVKPWHLARRHRKAWRTINPTWEFWFEAEAEFLEDLSGTSLEKRILAAKRLALFSGRWHIGPGAFASWLMRTIAVLGPIGTHLVGAIQSRSRR